MDRINQIDVNAVNERTREAAKHSTDRCWIDWVEDGVLGCTYNHAVGEECLMDHKHDEIAELYRDTLHYKLWELRQAFKKLGRSIINSFKK